MEGRENKHTPSHLKEVDIYKNMLTLKMRFSGTINNR